MAIRPPLEQVLRTYARFHQHPQNIICHYIGIPIITFATLALFSQIHLGAYLDGAGEGIQLDGGLVLFAINAIYFLIKDWKITVPFLLLNFGVYVVARQMPLLPSAVLFVLGWGTAIAGHKVFEKNQPAIFSNIKETVLGVGPMYMFAKLTGYFRAAD